MNYDHCTTAYTQLVNAWDMFMDTGAVTGGFSRPDVYTSWIRCSHEKIYGPIVPLLGEEIAQKQAQNCSLIANAKQVTNGIDNILHKILGPKYAVILMDAEGIIVDIVDRSSDAIPLGDRRKELYACSNAIDICKNENKVLEVYGYEHIYPTAADWHTIGNPIFNYDNSVAGGLGIVCETIGVSSIVPIVKIGSQLIQSGLMVEQIAKNKIGNLLEELPEGVIAINQQGIILNANQQFADLLDIPMGQIIGEKFTHYVMDDVNVNVNALTSPIDGFYVLPNVSLRAKNKIQLSVSMKKSLVGNFNSHPLILLLFKKLIPKTFIIPSPVAVMNDQLYSFNDLIGESPQILAVKKMAQKAAKTASNVLIGGESGTGKELIAQSIHRANRPNGPFVAINCGAFTKELLQSELFGYEEGAFTGAKKGGKPGKFELAEGGTLFLDEIGEMPIDMQVSLLRCLQEKTITRVGGAQAKKLNVRIIAATNRDLLEQVQKGSFREDLYYRLDVIEIRMPSLRESVMDIPNLSRHILNTLCQELDIPEQLQISAEAMECLCQHDWPGNVRELQNALERAIVCTDTNIITCDCLPPKMMKSASIELPNASCSLKDYEKIAIVQAIQKNSGNMSKSAEELGIARSTLYQKMDKLGIPHE